MFIAKWCFNKKLRKQLIRHIGVSNQINNLPFAAKNKRMKQLLIFSLSLVLLNNINAQFIGLNSRQITHLKELIKTDKAVGKMYNGFYKLAKTAIESKPNPRDTIVSQGHLKSDPNKAASELAMGDFKRFTHWFLCPK